MNKYKVGEAKIPALGAGFALSDNWQYILQKLTTSVENGRSRFSPNLGLLPFLLSQENMAAATFDLSGATQLNRGDGKKYQIVRRFYPRQSEDIHEGQSLQYCDISGDSTGYREDTISVGFEHTSAPLILDDRMLRCLEDDRDSFLGDRFAEHLRTYLQSLARKVNKRIVTGGLIGRHMNAAAVAAKDLPLLGASGAAINPVGEIMLLQDKTAAQIDDDFKLIGGTRLDVYRIARNITSANDAGFDASLSDSPAMIYRDNDLVAQLATAYGTTDAALAISAGALKFVSFNRFAGDFAYQGDKQERTTIVDPFLGLTHDVLYITDDCGDEIKRAIQFKTYYDVVGYPECWSDDECFDGVKDVFLYNIICGDASLCDISDDTCPKDAGDLVPFVENCAAGVAECVTFAASFAWSCENVVQYDYSSVIPYVYEKITVAGADYVFSQPYDTTTEPVFDAMMAELAAIFAANNLGEVVWWEHSSQSIAIFADAGTAINLATAGGPVAAFDEGPLAPVLKVQNTTGGAPLENAVWQVDGVTYAVAAGDLFDPVGDVLGTGEVFYLSGAAIGTEIPVVFTAIRDGLNSTTTGTVGPCV